MDTRPLDIMDRPAPVSAARHDWRQDEVEALFMTAGASGRGVVLTTPGWQCEYADVYTWQPRVGRPIAGEIVREFRKALRSRSTTGRNAAKRLEDYGFDQEASSRMDNERVPQRTRRSAVVVIH